MAIVTANSFDARGVTGRPLGWSIAKILGVTSLFCILFASLVQYIVLFNVIKRFHDFFEAEVASKVEITLKGYRDKITNSFVTMNKQQFGGVASEIFAQDESYELLSFYDAKGALLSQFKNTLVPQTTISLIAKKVNLNSLKTETITTITSTGFEMQARHRLEIVMPLQYANNRLGFVRMILSLSRVDERIEQLRYSASAIIIFTTIICNLIFLFVIRKTVTLPIERAVLLMEYVVDNIDRIPQLETKTTDALQIRKLVNALHAGLSEISLRHRTSNLLEKTKELLEKYKGETLLTELRDIWLTAKLAISSQVVIAQVHPDTKHYILKEMTPSNDTDNPSTSNTKRLRKIRHLQHLDIKKDILVDTVMKFLDKDLEIDWTDKWLICKAHFQVMSEENILILIIEPNEHSGLSPARFEELSLTWLREVARLYQEAHYKNISGEMELSKEVQRKWIIWDSKTNSNDSDLDMLYSCDSLLGNQSMSDFLFAVKNPQKMTSISVIGTVSARGIRGALASTSIVAALSDRYQIVKGFDQQRLINGLLLSINSYLWSAYKGQVNASCMVIHFDHQKGIGFFSTYGVKFPLLLTPHERKPLLIAQSESCSPLGSMENFNFVVTSFPVYPGQIVLGTTNGILSIENEQGQKFEKAILSGSLAEIIDLHYQDPAKVLLQKVFEVGSTFAVDRIIGSDLTCVILKRRHFSEHT